MTDPQGAPIRYDVTDPALPMGLVASNGVSHARVVEAVRAAVAQSMK